MGAASLLSRAGSLTALLLLVDFLDELVSGVPSLGAPEIRDRFGLPYAGLSLFVMTLPAGVALVSEPLLLAACRGRPPGPRVAAGMLAMACACGLGTLAPTPLALGLALSVLYVGSGVTCTLAQAALMDADPQRREQWMARWTFMGTLGDAATPVLFAVLAGFGLGYRGAFALCAGLCAAQALVLWRVARDGGVRGVAASGAADGAGHPPLLPALRAAFTHRALLLWSFGDALCLLLDEVLVAFAALHMREHLGFDAATRSAVFLSFSLGAAAGLVVFERLLDRGTPRRMLATASGACLLAYAAWLLTETPGASIAWMFVVGFCVAPQYPIARAQCYRAVPGDSLMVHFVGVATEPLKLGLPLLVGLVADRLGLSAALAVLALQPAVLLWLALRRR